MPLLPLSLPYEPPPPKPSFWRHPSTWAVSAVMVQAPWYPIGLGLGLARMGQVKNVWIDGAIYALAGVPSMVAIFLGLIGLVFWRSARWVAVGAILSTATVLAGVWVLRLLWQDYAATVLHSSNPVWPYL